jgi:transcriptional regulator with XRE-family HTH domain
MALVGQPDPAIHRRRIRSELRKARESAGLTQRDVAREMDWSLSKLIRIETGAVSIATNDLRALLNHYGMTDSARVNDLVQIARASRERSWWSSFKEVASPEYVAYLGYESSASIIRNFEPLLIPGLLQTEEYAREVISTFGGQDARSADALVDLRMERQELLSREAPPTLHFILDEAVVRRVVGGPAVMRRQLLKLLETGQHDNVTIRIIPFTVGMYPRLRVPYVLFEFPEANDEDVLYIENPQGEMLIRENSPEEEEAMTPIVYLGVFWQLEQIGRRGQATGIIEDALAGLAGLEEESAPPLEA